MNTTDIKSSGRSGLWAAVLPLVLVAAAYQQSVFGGFVWDDHVLIEEAPHVQSLEPVPSYFARKFWSDPLDPSRSFYRPLVTLSYALEWRLWSGAAGGFHLTNLIAHLLATLLLFLLARRGGASPLTAGLCAALFGVLPRLTESVAWISGRTDVFAAVFVFAALLLALARPMTAARAAAIAALIALGLFCKEVAIAAVPAVLLVSRRGEQPPGRALFTALGVMGMGYAVLRLVASAQDEAQKLALVRPPLGFPERLVAALGAIGHYGLMLADPLRPQLQIGQLHQPEAAVVLLGVALLCALGLVFWTLRHRLTGLQRGALAGAATALGLVLHLVPLDVTVLAADRFLYVPAGLLLVALAPGVEVALVKRRPLTLALWGLLLAGCAISTHLRTRLWGDEYALWREAVEERALGNSGVLLALSSVLMDAELYERALPHLERAIEEERSFPQLKTHAAFAVVLDKLGRRAEAIALFERMAAQQPDALRARLNLVMPYAREGRFDEAERELAAIRVLAPRWSALENVAAQLATARAEWVSLGRDQSLTPVERSYRQAQLAESLGARPEASRAYLEVLRDAEASIEQRLRAAGFFAFHGSPEQALEAIEEARRRGVPLDALAPLQDAARERDRLR